MSLNSLPFIRREPVKPAAGTIKPRPGRHHHTIPHQERKHIISEAKRLGLTREKAAEVFGISRSAAERLLAGIDTRRGPRTGHTMSVAEQKRIRDEVSRTNMTRAEVAAKYNITFRLAEKICLGLAALRGEIRKLEAKKPKLLPPEYGPMPFTRVRYVGGGTLTVSHGQGEEYAASMVEAMTVGREIESVEVVK